MRSKLAHFFSFLFVLGALVVLTNTAHAQKKNLLEIEQRLSQLGYWITKVDGKADASTRQAIIAFQKVERRKRTGVMNASDMEVLRSASRPMPKYTEGPHVEVDISRQVLFVVDESGSVTHILSVSTGNEEKYFDQGEWQKAHTPRGSFKVSWKVNGVRKASLGDLYYPSYFYGGVAIHGSPSIPTYPASHGCVRVPRFADKALSQMIPVGMTIHVYDRG